MTSKKDYVAIAHAINSTLQDFQGSTTTAVCDGIANRLADYFAGDNHRFDRQRFLIACGIEVAP